MGCVSMLHLLTRFGVSASRRQRGVQCVFARRLEDSAQPRPDIALPFSPDAGFGRCHWGVKRYRRGGTTSRPGRPSIRTGRRSRRTRIHGAYQAGGHPANADARRLREASKHKVNCQVIAAALVLRGRRGAALSCANASFTTRGEGGHSGRDPFCGARTYLEAIGKNELPRQRAGGRSASTYECYENRGKWNQGSFPESAAGCPTRPPQAYPLDSV
jgi:hypothetical protein